MNIDQLSLWQRIQAHGFDDVYAACPFSSRLAQENGWPPGFTRRAIEEYRRFVFLAVAAGHPVSPSDAVDQVWHLHLLYTRDYWGEFCPQVLRTPLHHGPTRGGAAEHDKFADWYGRTLASYRAFFGEPPAEFWPEPAAHPGTVRVDPARCWVIEKPRWLAGLRRGRGKQNEEKKNASARERLGAPSLAAPARPTGAALSLAAPGWPFDLAGPEFLSFFMSAGALALALAFALRWYLRQPATPPAASEKWDAYEASYLANGPSGSFVAALVGASHRKLVEVRGGKVVRTSEPLPPNLPLIERAVCAAAGPSGVKLPAVRAASRGAIEAIYAGLAERGFAMSESAARKARTIPALVLATMLLVGALKVKIGMDLGRPVGFLVLLLIVGTAVTLWFLLRRPRLTRRGSQALARLRAEHKRLVSTDRLALRGKEAPLLLPLAVGLFGVSALHGTPLHEMQRELKPVADAGSSGSTGCGSSGGGDGGGGGCGGCGGGGGD